MTIYAQLQTNLGDMGNAIYAMRNAFWESKLELFPLRIRLLSANSYSHISYNHVVLAFHRKWKKVVDIDIVTVVLNDHFVSMG